MNIKQYTQLHDQVRRALACNRINSALKLCRQAIGELPSDGGALAAQCRRLSETYGYLTSYTLDGYADPTRQSQRATISRSIERLMQLGAREVRVVDDSSLYYSTLRYRRLHPERTIENVAAGYRECAGRLSLAMLTAGPSDGTVRGMRQDLESRARELFDMIWTAAPLNESDTAAISALLADEVVSTPLRSMIAGALYLGLSEVFDTSRVGLLLDIYSGRDRVASLRALTYMLVWLSTAGCSEELASSSILTSRLAALAETGAWRDDVTAAFRQLLIGRDTDRVTRKMRDEIMPGLEQFGKDLTDRMKQRDVTPDNITDWEELLHDTDMGSAIHDLTAIQEEGGDVMMTTFAHLKRFPFFKEVSNWFVTYDPDHTMLPSSGGGVISTLASAPMLCDNDKYSLAFAIGHLPRQHSDMLTQQMAQNEAAMAEMQSASLDAASHDRDLIMQGIVRDLYRFFKLYERAGEFKNPFDTSLNLMAVPVLKGVIDGEAMMELAANFYFGHAYYADAAPLLREMERTMRPGQEGEVYHRMGVCAMHAGRYDEAVGYLERSELFDENNERNIYELGMAYRHQGNHRKAYDCFSRVIKRRPDDTALQLQAAAELIELERYDKALEMLYRLEYLYGLTPAFTRKLAVCELMTGRYDKCRAHLASLGSQTCSDMATGAVVEAVQGRFRAASDMLRSALRMAPDKEQVIGEFEGYAPVMHSAGIDPSVIEIIVDHVIE